jgi:hypothetical protein
MTKKNLSIAILFVSAVFLGSANYFLSPPPAMAATTVMGKGYQVCTATIQQGTDGVYILNNQTGIITCYSYDPTVRRIINRASLSVPDLFAAPMPPQR